MKILVTGGLGFIGKKLVERLISLGHNLIVIDKNDIDISKYDDLNKLFIENKFDIVFHLAAISSPKLSYENPVEDINTNILGTFNLLKCASENRVHKFINTSSVAVYGESESALREYSLLNPISQYGIGKMTGEHYTKLFANTLNVVNLRLFNVYGLGRGIVNEYLDCIMNDKPLLIKGSLDRFRDFVYIEDVINSYILALELKNGTYNVCTGVKTTIGSLLNKLLVLTGKPDFPVNVSRETNPGDPFGTLGSYAKIAQFGWKPQFSLDEGLLKMKELK